MSACSTLTENGDISQVVNVSASTLNLLFGAMSNIQYAGSGSLLQITLESVAFSPYTLVMILSSILFAQNGIKLIARKFFLLACFVMYALATAHFALDVRRLLTNDRKSQSLLLLMTLCVIELAEGPCSCGLDAGTVAALSPSAISSGCTSSILLSVNIILGDVIVSWRAYMLWRRNRPIQAVFTLLIIFTTITLIISASQSSCGPAVVPNSDLGFVFGGLLAQNALGNEFTDKYGAAAIVLSWSTNLLATTLISYKAWQHRRVIHRDLQTGGVQTRAEKLLMLFIESGVIYCTLWSVLVAATIIAWTPSNNDFLLKTRNFISAVQTLKSSALIHLIGVYPTIIVVLGAFTNSYYERTLRYSAVATPNVGPIVIATVKPELGASDTTLESSEQHTDSTIPVLSIGSLGSFSAGGGHEDGKADTYNAT